MSFQIPYHVHCQGRENADTACLLITFLQCCGSIKIGQLYWPFDCWHCYLSCDSRSWASAVVDPDCLVFTQRLWRGGKVGVAPSIVVTCSHESVVVSFALPATQSSVAAPWGPPDFVDEAKRLRPRFPLTQSSPNFEVLWKISLKKFQCWKNVGEPPGYFGTA